MDARRELRRHLERAGIISLLLSADFLASEDCYGVALPLALQRAASGQALEWVIDQYQVSKDARSGISSDPNNPHDPEYIVRLLKQVITVSVKTVALVDQLARAVTQDDWLEPAP